jgi:hypothetical protein
MAKNFISNEWVEHSVKIFTKFFFFIKYFEWYLLGFKGIDNSILTCLACNMHRIIRNFENSQKCSKWITYIYI